MQDASKQQTECWTDLERWIQVGHSLAGVALVAIDYRCAAGAEVQLDLLGLIEDALQAAVDSKPALGDRLKRRPRSLSPIDWTFNEKVTNAEAYAVDTLASFRSGVE